MTERDPRFSEFYELVENEGLSPDYIDLLIEKYGEERVIRHMLADPKDQAEAEDDSTL